MLQGWTLAGIVSLQSGLPWFPADVTNDLVGTNEFQDSIDNSQQTWNYTGPKSAFRAGNTAFPFFTGAAAASKCLTAAQAPYAGNANQMGLAAASLANIGCYVTAGGGILTPPAYGTIGNANRNIFRIPPYYNVDFSVSKDWKFKERIGVQFRAELFNIFNFTNWALPASANTDPSGGALGAITQSPDVANQNPILGSGGPRHIQFGLKISY
jgi:hypothetical protein